jgi:AcrR family transcriptional regulator
MARNVRPLEPKQERSLETRRRLLDAAIEELLEVGYAGLSTTAVARRAGVTRGAQQHHFPHKDVLVAASVEFLGERMLQELRDEAIGAPRGRRRIERALDSIFRQFRGPLFTAILELALATRIEPGLRAVVSAQERRVGEAVAEYAAEVFDDACRGKPEFSTWWATTIATVRGVALLDVLGHQPSSIDRQWRAARAQLVRELLQMQAVAAPSAEAHWPASQC